MDMVDNFNVMDIDMYVMDKMNIKDRIIEVDMEVINKLVCYVYKHHCQNLNSTTTQ